MTIEEFEELAYNSKFRAAIRGTEEYLQSLDEIEPLIMDLYKGYRVSTVLIIAFYVLNGLFLCTVGNAIHLVLSTHTFPLLVLIGCLANLGILAFNYPMYKKHRVLVTNYKLLRSSFSEMKVSANKAIEFLKQADLNVENYNIEEFRAIRAEWDRQSQLHKQALAELKK